MPKAITVFFCLCGRWIALLTWVIFSFAMIIWRYLKGVLERGEKAVYQLAIEHFLDGDTALLCDGKRRAQLLQGVDGCFHNIVRVGRAV